MRGFSLIIVAMLCLSLLSCGRSEGTSESYNYEETTEEEYYDGDYCAEVEYYNPNTGTRSTYTLNVEVEDNELTVIHWPNGGWLDDDHFYPEDISDGECNFTSDKGYDFTVTLTGDPCSYTDERKFLYDQEDDRAAVTCSRCGGSKYEYDDYCEDCTDEEENTCSRCGAYEYGVYGGLCSSCQDDD